MKNAFVVTPAESSWAVKHDGSFLGYANSQEQAVKIANHLRDYLTEQGRDSDLLIMDCGHRKGFDPTLTS